MEEHYLDSEFQRADDLIAQDLIEEDAVYSEVVSNLRARDNSISVIKLNPPYDMMVDFSKNTMWSG